MLLSRLLRGVGSGRTRELGDVESTTSIAQVLLAGSGRGEDCDVQVSSPGTTMVRYDDVGGLRRRRVGGRQLLCGNGVGGTSISMSLSLRGVWQRVYPGASACSFGQKSRSRDQGWGRGRGGGSIGGGVHPTLGVATPLHVVERGCSRVCVTSIERPARNRSRRHVGAVSASVRDAPWWVCVCWGVDWRARRRSDVLTDAGRVRACLNRRRTGGVRGGTTRGRRPFVVPGESKSQWWTTVVVR